MAWRNRKIIYKGHGAVENIKTIIIVGGGTAGWMAAASLAQFLRGRPVEIHLVESADIGTIGVGEATIPGIRDFNASLGIDEADFIKSTQASFKLGIQFQDWKTIGSRFFHPFASYGAPIDGVDFYPVWQHLYKQGKARDLQHYCLPSVLSAQNKFAQANLNASSPLARYHYAYHFDAALYAAYLRKYAEAGGVVRHEDKVIHVKLHDNGFIKSVVLEKNKELEGELFIDCSGFRGLLIEGALKTGYENWSHWLPVNSAVAVQSESALEPVPFTRATALESGWQWRIPLQHRVGNGYVFCDKFISHDHAAQSLLDKLDGPAATTPKVIKFITGRRKQFWNKNCVALGLASGFLEPLESTSISLIQTGISKLLMFFPEDEFNQDDISEANRLAEIEMERIRDFILLHYKLSQRNDSEFWRYVQTIEAPETLANKIAIFKRRGHLINYEGESFGDASWLSMYNGFGVLSKLEDVRIHQLDMDSAERQLNYMHKVIQESCAHAMSHKTFLDKYCPAPKVAH
jgi:tryptophan 7-halogenase